MYKEARRGYPHKPIILRSLIATVSHLLLELWLSWGVLMVLMLMIMLLLLRLMGKEEVYLSIFIISIYLLFEFELRFYFRAFIYEYLVGNM